MPYWQGFPAFVPVVPVVPVKNGRGRKEKGRSGARGRGAAGYELRQKKPGKTTRAEPGRRRPGWGGGSSLGVWVAGNSHPELWLDAGFC